MREFGLIGHPLTHSFSKKFFEQKFREEHIGDCSYDLFDLPRVNEFPELLKRHPHLQGVNVTIPYKVAILPYLSGLSEEARQTGAVNTIRIREHQIIGHNTDVYGFKHSLLPLIDRINTRALIFGTGGASKAVVYVLKTLNIPYQQVSRTGSPLGYQDLSAGILASANLLINTTPLGMFPDTDSCVPIPFGLLNERHLVYDLVYNPEMTKLLQLSAERGCRVKNGLEMLYLQAEKSWEIWNEG